MQIYRNTDHRIIQIFVNCDIPIYVLFIIFVIYLFISNIFSYLCILIMNLFETFMEIQYLTINLSLFCNTNADFWFEISLIIKIEDFCGLSALVV